MQQIELENNEAGARIDSSTLETQIQNIIEAAGLRHITTHWNNPEGRVITFSNVPIQGKKEGGGACLLFTIILLPPDNKWKSCTITGFGKEETLEAIFSNLTTFFEETGVIPKH